MSAEDASGRRAVAGSEPAQLPREFTLWSAFSLAFAYISPIVAVYGVFALALMLVGPGFWLAIPIALAGQYLVALALGEVSSRFPLEGSLYQWAGRLHGKNLGWMTGWIYIWTVMIALATVAVGAAHFWGEAFGLDLSSKHALILAAVVVLAFSTIANTLGRRPLKIMIGFSIAAEIIGSIGLGITLLFYRVNPISVIIHNGLSGSGGWHAGALTLGIALAGWSFLGFESAGAVGEEVQDPHRNVPKALRYSLLAIGVIVLFATLSLILAIPDLKAVTGGSVADPVASTISAHLGTGITRAAEAVFATGFTACALGLQTGISRVIWAFARDRALPASGWLVRLSRRQGVPVNAIVVTAVLPVILFLLTGSNVYNLLVDYTIGGWYLTFVLVLGAALLAHMRHSWQPGQFSLGRWSLPVVVVALAWALFETINVAWPRAAVTGSAWYLQWAVVLVLALLVVAGAVVLMLVRTRMTVRAGHAEPGTTGVRPAGTAVPPAGAGWERA
jgi:amino acid transporter